MTNPKQLYGDKKPSLSLFPMTAQLAAWEAFQDGANKYGPFNWREKPVEIQTYIDAALRHLRLYESGEEKARDTGVSNLGAVIACCSIIIDSVAHNTAIDNRQHSPVTCDELHKAEEMVQHLKFMQEMRDREKEELDQALKSPIVEEDFSELENRYYKKYNETVLELALEHGLFEVPDVILQERSKRRFM